MDNLTNQFKGLLTDSVDYDSVAREDKFLAFLICKNLSDLCETGIYILENIKVKGKNCAELPDEDMIKLVKTILSGLFSSKMFVADEEYGSVPDWDIVENYDRKKTEMAIQTYHLLKRNIVLNPDIDKIRTAVEKRDKKYVLINFDKIFQGAPFEEQLQNFKNFIASPHVKVVDQESVWEFIESLMDIFMSEDEMRQTLKNL